MADADEVILGPYCEIRLADARLPLWIVPFDASGACAGPETLARVVAELAGGGYTDVFVFSHGWNNTFARASERYEAFIRGYHEFVGSHGLPQPSPYKPLLVGIYWPSIDLILPREAPPAIAGLQGASETAGGEMDLDSMARVAEESLAPERAADLRGLLADLELAGPNAQELAELLAEAYPDDDEVDAGAARPAAQDLMRTWTDLVGAGFTDSAAGPAGPESFGVAVDDRSAAGPQAAGAVSTALRSAGRLDPRDILRAFTVYKMKDRAGRVGASGGAALLRDLLSASEQPRLHLIGHSYGCRLLLSAICAEEPPRPVSSLLLLEPAVNYLCFAREVPKHGRPGGFRSVLTRVEEPILSTFSPRDRALRDFFHIAVRRRSDVGELKPAALGVTPSIYAALGGWGPGGLDGEAQELPLALPPNRYPPAHAGCRVYALNGAVGITSHSDVINEWTYWALYNQVVA
jgi:pimeloyl-ACP methyl ester carboxylesterase